jgi:hypothetical protein
MLSLPTKSFRVKAGAALAALYAFCMLLPPVAFALADGSMALPCLVDDLAALSTQVRAAVPVPSAEHHHGGASDADAGAETHHHAHADGVPGAEAPEDSHSGKSRAGECGLFPMAALAGVLRPAPAPSRLTSIVIPLLADALIGRGPDRIIRPPIA